MSERNFILAIVGLCGTGKSVVTRYIEGKYNLKSIYFGGFVLEEVKNRGLEINSANEKLVREDLRQQFGPDVMAQKAHQRITSYLAGGENVIIDGLYSFSEYLYLREKFPRQLVVLSIHSSRRFRYQRLGRRKIRPLTPREVDERDFFEIKNIEKAGPIAAADYHIINDRGIPILHKDIDRIMKRLLDPR
jgi:dephospho-CoA kinase